ncbi:MAG: insulinase family protein [Kangiellaceae bacterium]|nr:insulinase family protein [Kangiellaceae bacterium]MCW9018076.1 insulinase family protein [Kangiellaceae bacterium]
MKLVKRIIGASLALLSLSSMAAFKIPVYEKYKLDNGLEVYLMQQTEVPLIDISLTIKAGAIHDEKSYGLANLTGESLMFGSGKLSKTEIEDKLAFHGAELYSSTGMESSDLSMSIAAKDQKEMLKLLQSIVLKPKFDKDEFDKFKKRLSNQLIQRRESPRNVIGSVFGKMYYGEHPYGNPVIGDLKSIEKVKLDDVKSFYSKYYTPNNAAIIVVGDFEKKSMKKQIAKLFSNWKGQAPKAKVLPLVNPKTDSNVWIINKEDATETTFMIGGKGINSSHPDYVAAEVINTILGGRFTSWLNDELRVNSGLTYGARSGFSDHSVAGSFAISTFTKTRTTFEAVDLALKTYEKLWEKGIDAETLASAKAYVKGQFPPDFETSGQLAALLSRMWVLGLDDSFINDFEAKVDSLNVESANKLAKKLFPRENLQFVLVGKALEIKEKAKNYGKIKQMDIDKFTY